MPPVIAAGLLPVAWARLFTTLRTLYLQGNNFTAKPDGSSTPAALLPAWTSEGAFPKLSALYLYPGNSLICSLPDYSEDEMGTFQDVNRGELGLEGQGSWVTGG